MYTTFIQANKYSWVSSQVSSAVVEKLSAPPMDDFDQLTYFLVGIIQYEWPQEDLDKMAVWWREITGSELSALLKSDCDIPNLIQTLKFREAGLVRMYHQPTTDERKISRATLMELHAKFFTEYGCRITDFTTDQSFLFTVENHILCQVA
jgi:hypothetical protein